MKLFALLALTLFSQTNGISCPPELTQSESINSAITMYYAVVTSSSEPDIMCARIESSLESWVGFGISPTGMMIGAEAVIGLPDDGTVLKYELTGKSTSLVVPMSDDKQTLTDTSITQEGGMTVLSFTKILDEDQYEIVVGPNTFIFALGTSNSLGYHADRGVFSVDLVAEEETVTTSSELASATTTTAEQTTTLLPSTTAAETATELASTTSTTVGEASTTITTAEETTTVLPSTTAADTTTVSFESWLEDDNMTYAPSPAGTDDIGLTYSPTADEGAKVTYAPSSFGTSSVGVSITPSPSVVESEPASRTAEPTLASDGMADDNETEAVIQWTNTSASDFAPDATVEESMNATTPSTTTSTETEVQPEEESESAEGSASLEESEAREEGENGATMSVHLVGSVALGIMTAFAIA
eukprot:scaffold12431_cov94-Cyclotella_meneghiniana.AAC.6